MLTECSDIVIGQLQHCSWTKIIVNLEKQLGYQTVHGTAVEVKWQGNSNSLLIANNVLTVLYESQKIHLTSATLMNPVLLLSMSQCSPLHVLVSVTSAVNLCDTYNITYTRGLVVISWHLLWDGRYYVLWGFFFSFFLSLSLFFFFFVHSLTSILIVLVNSLQEFADIWLMLWLLFLILRLWLLFFHWTIQKLQREKSRQTSIGGRIDGSKQANYNTCWLCQNYLYVHF